MFGYRMFFMGVIFMLVTVVLRKIPDKFKWDMDSKTIQVTLLIIDLCIVFACVSLLILGGILLWDILR